MKISNTEQNININNQFIKIVVALFIAATTPAIICFSIISSMLFINRPESWLEAAGAAIEFGIIVFIIALIHTFIFGAPLFILGLFFKMIRWWTTLIGGFTIGFMPYTILMLTISISLDTTKEMFPYVLAISLILSLFGVSGGISFWLLWKYWVKKETTISNANS